MKANLFARKPHYCFGIDDNYVWPLLVCLYSAKRSFSKLKKVHIIYDPKFLQEKSIIKIINACDLLEISPKFISLQIPENALGVLHITPTSYLRLQIPQIFQRKVFWFDTDLLFLKGWQEISHYAWHKDVNKYAIFARLHWGNPRSTSNQAIIESKGKYFNSGVLLFNPRLWENGAISNNLSSIISNYANLGFEWADQCLLNYYFRGDYGQIDYKYNSIPAEYIKNRTRIIHFAGTHKPWTNYMNSAGEIVKIEGHFENSDLQPEDEKAWALYRNVEKELFEFLSK
jgi:lipopolysaccharide biosynthesis glycosyltransferase